MNKPNVFSKMAEDSDDDVAVQKQTKTQKKKEDRKITEKAAADSQKPIKINQNKMMEGGFEVTDQQQRGDRNERGRGGRGGGDRGGNRGGDRGGRGRGGRGGGDRPRTANYKLDADGNRVPFRDDREGGEGRKFGGKPREGDHPFDKQSGMGRGRKPQDRKGGAGKFGQGERPDITYKRKRGGPGEGGEEGDRRPKTADAPAEGEAEEAKVVVEEKKEVITEEVITEIIGYSLDDFRKGKSTFGRKEARKAEGVKGKIQAVDNTKVHQTTVQKNEHGLAGFVADTSKEKGFLNFAANVDEPEESSRGGRGGRGRGGRGGNEAPQRGGRRQNPKAALKKTDDEFPTL